MRRTEAETHRYHSTNTIPAIESDPYGFLTSPRAPACGLPKERLERIPIMFEHSLHAARSFCILEG
jgi:hypothetical protein